MATIRVLKFSTKIDPSGFVAGATRLETFSDKLSKGVGRKLDFGPKIDFGGASGGLAAIGKSAGLASGALGAIAGAGAAVAFQAIGAAAHVAGEAITGLARGISSSIKAASDLTETLGKTDVILGSASGQVKAFADDMAKRFGSVKRETLDVASEIGGLAKSVGGLDGKDLGNFTKQFTLMAANLVSIKNLPDLKTAGDALRIGLGGEQSDLLKGLGANLTEANVKAFAFGHGIAKAGQELSDFQKFTARAGILTEKLKFAEGNLADTIKDPANAFRMFTGTISNLSAELGGVLMPVARTALSILNGGVSKLRAYFESIRPAAVAFGESLAAGFARVGDLASHLWPTIKGFASTILGFYRDIGAKIISWLPSISTVGDALKGAFATIDIGYRQLIGGLKAFPGYIDAAFGGVPSAAIAKLAGQIKDGLSQAIAWAGFGIRNMGDIFAMAMLSIGQRVAWLQDNFALIPKNLGIVGNWVKTDFVSTMMDAFIAIGEGVKALGKGFWDFLGNPAGGIKFDFAPMMREMQSAILKLPKLDVAEMVDITAPMKALEDSIVARESAFHDQMAETMKPAAAIAKAAAPALAPPGDPGSAFKGTGFEEQAKPAELKFAGAVELGSTEAYSALVKAFAGGGANSKAEAQNRDKLTIARESAGLLRQLVAGQGRQMPELVI